MTDYTQFTADKIYNLYATGKANPIHVIQQVLDKINKLNPIVNAFCFVDPISSLKQAEDSAARWACGQPLSALDGIPLAVKDSIHTQGWPTLYASRTVNANQIWAHDDPIVADLRKAGVVFVGKTTMSEFGYAANHSDSLIYGSVKNPWRLDFSPGGSSGGSAVAVATGMATLALGTDRGGSISVPSAWNGVIGYKPTEGIMPVDPVDVLNLSSLGLLTRSVVDIETVLLTVNSNKIPQTGQMFSKKQIAFAKGFHHDKLAQWFQNQNCVVKQIPLPFKEANEIFDQLVLPKIYAEWSSIPKHLQKLTDKEIHHRAILAHTKEQTYHYLVKRQELIYQIDKSLEQFDYVVCPVTNYAMLDKIKYQNRALESVLFTVTKQPTTTVPIGLDHQGMPIGILIAGKKGCDWQMLQLVKHLCEEFKIPRCPL